MPTPEYQTITLFDTIAAADSPATSDTIEAGDYSKIGIQVIGTGIGGADSLQFYQSNDGTNWVALGAAITATGVTEDAIYCRYVRAIFTIDTGTAISVIITLKD